jgi:hypothetical protein
MPVNINPQPKLRYNHANLNPAVPEANNPDVFSSLAQG